MFEAAFEGTQDEDGDAGVVVGGVVGSCPERGYEGFERVFEEDVEGPGGGLAVLLGPSLVG